MRGSLSDHQRNGSRSGQRAVNSSGEWGSPMVEPPARVAAHDTHAMSRPSRVGVFDALVVVRAMVGVAHRTAGVDEEGLHRPVHMGRGADQQGGGRRRPLSWPAVTDRAKVRTEATGCDDHRVRPHLEVVGAVRDVAGQ
jgi:hypothetical protein